MAAKKSTTKAKKTAANKTPEGTDKPWFPEDAKTPAPPAPVKKASPWQRRAVIVNYGTLAKPGICLRTLFNTHITENHSKITDSQRDQLWKTVGARMLTEPTTRLTDIISEELKASKLV